MNVAVILAGGIGSRVGANRPKQFIEILGKPVLVYTIEVFQNHPEIDAIEVVCHKLWKDYLNEIVDTYSLDKVKWVTDGGETFQESVLNGINYLNGKISREDMVLVHFGASPFIKEDIISDCIRVCREKGNAISATDYFLLSGEKNSRKSVDDPENYTDVYIDRDTVACMNSPHAFKYGFIKDMYDEAIETGVINKVEPHTTSLMYKMGKKIYFAKGSQTNVKITRKEDLNLFEGYVMQKNEYEAQEMTGDVVVFLADGFEECEGLLVVDLLRRAGIKTVMASIMGRRTIDSSRHIPVVADTLAEAVDYDNVKMIVLPGGRIGSENLGKSELVKEKCVEFARDKMIAAVCAAPLILASLGLLEGKQATCHPDFEDKMNSVVITGESVSVEGNIITGQGLGATIPFALEIVKAIVNVDMANKIKKDICFKSTDNYPNTQGFQ